MIRLNHIYKEKKDKFQSCLNSKVLHFPLRILSIFWLRILVKSIHLYHLIRIFIDYIKLNCIKLLSYFLNINEFFNKFHHNSTFMKISEFWTSLNQLESVMNKSSILNPKLNYTSSDIFDKFLIYFMNQFKSVVN